MKKLFSIILFSFIIHFNHSQSLIGSWEMISKSKGGIELKTVVIFADSYQVATTFELKTGKFIASNGGNWSIENNVLTEIIEFDNLNPDNVGKKISSKISFSKNSFEIKEHQLKYTRIDKGTPGILNGAWLMSGRIRDGKTQNRDTSRPRKTMKILSGTRFQWIAYNTETKKFMGTGGGTYTTVEGKYSENIEFFSKDNTKAGMSLSFKYELINNEWHHSGKSSKGKPIYEIWSIRK